MITPITRTTPAAVPRYSSVQVAPFPPLPADRAGPDAWPEEAHIELNTDLLYVNHSGDPNVGFEVPPPGKDKWLVRALKDIEEGEVRSKLGCDCVREALTATWADRLTRAGR